jgi:hypothetical protein
VRARGACTLIGVDQRALQAVLGDAPELAEHVSRVIAERQAAAEMATTAASDDRVSVEERSSQLLGRIRRFFAL